MTLKTGISRLALLWAVLARQVEHPMLNLSDGVKLQGAWLSLRPSNTEPIVRAMGEVRA